MFFSVPPGAPGTNDASKHLTPQGPLRAAPCRGQVTKKYLTRVKTLRFCGQISQLQSQSLLLTGAVCPMTDPGGNAKLTKTQRPSEPALK